MIKTFVIEGMDLDWLEAEILQNMINKYAYGEIPVDKKLEIKVKENDD